MRKGVLIGVFVLAVCGVLAAMGFWGPRDRTLEQTDVACDLSILTGGGVSVDPRCMMFAPEGADDEFEQTVDMMRDRVVGFSDEYGLHESSFVYSGAVPLFSGELAERVDQWSVMSPELQSEVAERPEVIELSAEEYAAWRLMSFSYYVTRREKLDQLGPCSRTNYDVAMMAIDHKLVMPGDEFNVNKRVAYRIGYCASAEDYANFSFQSGVCGVSSQVFRTALIHPDLEVVERHPHRIWYERYYDKTLWGDDAAMIQWRKQLRTVNTSDHPIYFRTRNEDGASSALMVAISPTRDERYVQIERQQIADLQGSVSTTTYSGSGEVLYQMGWVSDYVARDAGVVN